MWNCFSVKRTIVLLSCACTLLGPAVAVRADQVILDDLIVTFSVCIGPDCAVGTDFGYNTLILKGETPWLNFWDTSSSAAFPTQDWNLVINDAQEGGAEYFAIGDESNPQGFDFRIDAGDNIFHIQADRVLVGTADSPRVLSHLADGVADSDAATVGQLQPLASGLQGALATSASQQSRLDVLSGQVGALELTVEQMDVRLEEVESDSTGWEARLQALDQASSRQEAQLTVLDGEVAALDGQLQNLAQTGQEQNAQLQQQGALLTQATQLLQENAQVLGAQATVLEAQEQVLQVQGQQLGLLDSQVGDHQVAIERLQQQSQGLAFTAPAVGSSFASAFGLGATAVGAGAVAHDGDTAVGSNAVATADNAVAVGADSRVASLHGVAVGAQSQVAQGAEGGVAVGQNAQVLAGAAGSVALGQNAVADEANVVSVGSAGQERRVSHVAAGVRPTDAVNLAQLYQLDAQTSRQIDGLERRLDGLEQRLDQVGALASAFSAMVPNARDDSRNQLSVGMGYYSGASALALGTFHSPSDNLLINTGVSTAFDRNATAARLGLTIGL